MKQLDDFWIGDTAWFVPVDPTHGKPRLAKLTMKGTKYTYFDNELVREHNNGFSFAVGEFCGVTGIYYENQETYISFLRWQELCKDLKHKRLKRETRLKIMEMVNQEHRLPEPQV